jgi:hypothetical protein
MSIRNYLASHLDDEDHLDSHKVSPPPLLPRIRQLVTPTYGPGLSKQTNPMRLQLTLAFWLATFEALVATLFVTLHAKGLWAMSFQIGVQIQIAQNRFAYGSRLGLEDRGEEIISQST